MSSETTFESGTEFLGYRLEELIGQGGMGVVYRAYDRRLKRTVAVKFITPELALDERFRERFLRESELAAAFEHPNAVPIHDAGDVDGRLYLAMRYVEGSDLAVLLRSAGLLEPARAVRICAQVARALDAAHASGLVHRDVKPSNVLLDAGEHVYVADFGLTRRLVDEGGPLLDGRSLGTPAYLAPEQLEGEPVDGRADLYSLACLLYECLTGEPPFRQDSRLAVAWAHLEQEPPSASARNAALPAAVDEPLRTALAKDPADRQPTCAALIAATETALGLHERPSFPKKWLVAALAVVALAAAAAALAVLTVGGGGTSVSPALFGRNDTLVRVDPETNTVSTVVHVGIDPVAVAAGGSHVWVYNYPEDTIMAIDPRTNRPEGTTNVNGGPLDLKPSAGPVLAADTSGAWLVGVDAANRPALVHVEPGLKHAETHRLDRDPRGVAVGFGAVWVVTRERRRSELLRIDPRTADVVRRWKFPREAPINSVAAGLGYVWAVSASGARLYRIDPGTGGARKVQLASRAGLAPRPSLMRGFVWVGNEVFRPRTLKLERSGICCTEDGREFSGGFDSAWGIHPPSGTLEHWGSDWELVRAIQIVANPPVREGPCLSSVASSADAVWVTAAPSLASACPTPILES